MNKKILMIGICAIIGLNQAHAQAFLKKLKEKAEQVADKAIDKKTDELLNGKKTTSADAGSAAQNGQGGNYQPGPGQPSATDGYSSGQIRNKGGAGLISTPPDVMKNLDESEKAYNANTLGEARLSIQQAILGVEMQIGKDILAKLPAQLDGLDADKEQEKVLSAGWGWEGMVLTKAYQKNDKALTINIINNNSIATAYSAFLAGNAYGAQSSPGMKQVKIKNQRGILEYTDRDGYKLTIPIGQSTVMHVLGVNYATENEFMNAANGIDIEMIKKNLDEK